MRTILSLLCQGKKYDAPGGIKKPLALSILKRRPRVGWGINCVFVKLHPPASRGKAGMGVYKGYFVPRSTPRSLSGVEGRGDANYRVAASFPLPNPPRKGAGIKCAQWGEEEGENISA